MGSFSLGKHSEPQPDLAIFPFDPEFYARRPYPKPNEFVAFIEIASSSFSYDAEVKMRLYARFGIPDYLLVDVKKHRLLRYRDPATDGYATVRELSYGDTFALARLPEIDLVADAFLRFRRD